MKRLYTALCEWLEASTKELTAPIEHHPEGAGEARSEHAHSYSSPPELHAASDRQSIDDDNGARKRTIGFTPNN